MKKLMAWLKKTGSNIMFVLEIAWEIFRLQLAIMRKAHMGYVAASEITNEAMKRLNVMLKDELKRIKAARRKRK